VNNLGAVTAAFLPLSSAGASAEGKRFYCSVTELETKVGSKSNFRAEIRSIVIVFNEQMARPLEAAGRERAEFDAYRSQPWRTRTN